MTTKKTPDTMAPVSTSQTFARDPEFGPETERGGGDIVKLEVGQVLLGTLTEWRTNVKTEISDESELITVVDDNGELKSMWVSTVLHSRLLGTPLMSRVRIQRIADVPAKKKGYSPTKMYRVNVRTPEAFTPDTEYGGDR